MSSLQGYFLDDETGRVTPSRRVVRERVMQALYACEIAREAGADEAVDLMAERIVYPEFLQNAELLEFAQRLLRLTYNQARDCDTLISSLAEHWELHRIAPIDRVLLRIAIVEMTHFPEIPTRVSINEVIEIAKRYSTDKSGVFINGVLDAARNRLKEVGQLVKTGRGLHGENPKDAVAPE